MSPSVVSLVLVVSKISPSRVPTILENIRDQLPQLKDLDIYYEMGTEGLPPYDDEIAGLLQALPKLTTLSLPLFCLNASMIRALSQHQSLESILVDSSSTYVPYPCNERERERSLVLPNKLLETGAFPSLNQLSLSTPSLTDAQKFFTQPGFPGTNLRSLWFHTTTIPSPASFGELLTYLAGVCPFLTDLEMILQARQYSRRSDFSSVEALGARDLHPLLGFNSLHVFRIRHPYPIDISDTELRELVSKWPRLCVFDLNPHPVVSKVPTLTLGAFVTLATYCPYLFEIGLYVDATAAPPSVPPWIIVSRRQLDITTLHIGRSPLLIGANAPVTTFPQLARYLAHFMVDSSKTDWEWPNEDDLPPRLRNEWNWWASVAAYSRDDVETYVAGWKIVAAMTSLVLEGRRSVWEWNEMVRQEI